YMPDCNDSSNIYCNLSTCTHHNTGNQSNTEWMPDSGSNRCSLHSMVSKCNNEWWMSGSNTHQQRTCISTCSLYRRNSNSNLDSKQYMPERNDSSNIYRNSSTCTHHNAGNQSNTEWMPDTGSN